MSAAPVGRPRATPPWARAARVRAGRRGRGRRGRRRRRARSWSPRPPTSAPDGRPPPAHPPRRPGRGPARRRPAHRGGGRTPTSPAGLAGPTVPQARPARVPARGPRPHGPRRRGRRRPGRARASCSSGPTRRPFGERADPDLVVAATRRALAGGRRGAGRPRRPDPGRGPARRSQPPVFADLARDFALEDTDALLGRLVADLPPDTLVLVVSVVPPGRRVAADAGGGRRRRRGPGLAALAVDQAAGPGDPHRRGPHGAGRGGRAGARRP